MNPQSANDAAASAASPSTGLNPLFQVGGLLFFATPLMISIDRVSAGAALALVLLLCPLVGIMPWRLLRLAWPVLLAAVIAGTSMALYGNPEGRVYASFLMAHVTDRSLLLAQGIALRVLAIGLSAVAVLRTIHIARLGQALCVHLRLPARPVLAAMAGLRMVTLFHQEWRTLALARRARGLRAGWFSRAYVLLVRALRRAATLSTAMEARAFGAFDADHPRTWARPSPVRARDWWFLVGCLAAAGVALGLSVWAGEFRFLGVS